MFRSSRLRFIALVGLAVLNPIGEYSSAQTGPANSQSKPRQATDPVDLKPIQDAIDRLAGSVKTQQDQKNAEADKERADRDLKAQEDMAKWASYLFWATVASLILTLGGLLLIWRTLVHTKIAADASAKMVFEAEKTTAAAIKGAEAAERSAADAREQLITSRRPWLSVTAEIAGDLQFLLDGAGEVQGLVDIEFKINNFGNSPAIATLIYARIQPWPVDAFVGLRSNFVESLHNRKDCPTLGYNVVPGGTKWQTHSLPIFPRDIEKGLAIYNLPGFPRGICTQVLVCVAYDDPATKTTHETGAVFNLGKVFTPAGTIISADLGVIEKGDLELRESIVGAYVT